MLRTHRWTGSFQLPTPISEILFVLSYADDFHVRTARFRCRTSFGLVSKNNFGGMPKTP